jgi:malic enzyme
MAIYATQRQRVTDEMFIEAVLARADRVRLEELQECFLFPPQSNILETEIKVAARVQSIHSQPRLQITDSKKRRLKKPTRLCNCWHPQPCQISRTI